MCSCPAHGGRAPGGQRGRARLREPGGSRRRMPPARSHPVRAAPTSTSSTVAASRRDTPRLARRVPRDLGQGLRPSVPQWRDQGTGPGGGSTRADKRGFGPTAGARLTGAGVRGNCVRYMASHMTGPCRLSGPNLPSSAVPGTRAARWGRPPRDACQVSRASEGARHGSGPGRPRRGPQAAE